jgi:predicted HNH restriction endonuclease
MPDLNIKEKLINKKKGTKDISVLEEVADLFEFREDEGVYKVNAEQEKAIDEARVQVTNKQTLTDEQSNNKTDEWLNG